MAFISTNCSDKKYDVIYLHSSDEEVLTNNNSVLAQMQDTLVNDLNVSMEEIAIDIK